MNVDAQCSPGCKMEGRELDVLVAEAMGWSLLGDSETITLYAGHQVSRVFGKVGLPPGRSAAIGMRIVPYFSTDVAAVLPAAEQVVGGGYIEMALMPQKNRDNPQYAQVTLWTDDPDPVRTAAEAATGTEAIALALARAVVKAKGVETAP